MSLREEIENHLDDWIGGGEPCIIIDTPEITEKILKLFKDMITKMYVNIDTEDKQMIKYYSAQRIILTGILDKLSE